MIKTVNVWAKNKEAKTNLSLDLLFILFVENLNNTIDWKKLLDQTRVWVTYCSLLLHKMLQKYQEQVVSSFCYVIFFSFF